MGLLPGVVSCSPPEPHQSTATIADNNPVLLHVAVPNSFSTMAEITPTMSLVVEIPENSEKLMQSSIFNKWELYGSFCVSYPNNSRTVI